MARAELNGEMGKLLFLYVSGLAWAGLGWPDLGLPGPAWACLGWSWPDWAGLILPGLAMIEISTAQPYFYAPWITSSNLISACLGLRGLVLDG
jgi:hypothetical protein